MKSRIANGVCMLFVVNIVLVFTYIYLLGPDVTERRAQAIIVPNYWTNEERQTPDQTLCPLIRRPTDVKDAQVWQEVGLGNNIYVFSAFYDDAGTSPIVRLLGLSVFDRYGSLLCQLWFKDSKRVELYEIQAHVEMLKEGHKRKYRAVYLKCPIPKNRRPYAVSIVSKSCKQPLNFLPVMYSKKTSTKFTVCVTPLNFKYSRAFELLEMVEFNKLMGAQKLMFYNYSTGTNVDAILKHYVAEGSVEVVQWHLPVRVDTWPPNERVEVHYFAQIAALNDCLYRHLHSSKYIVFTDLDEFVIPKVGRTWSSLVQKRLSVKPKTGAFIIKCIFFRKEWPEYSKNFSGRTDAVKYKSILLLNVLREFSDLEYFTRSKLIILPTRVETVGVHQIWKYRPGYTHDKVPKTDALLHHYRDFETPKDGKKRIRDIYVHRFKDKLLAQLRSTWGKLPKVPLNIPLSNYSKPL
ncbi:glycosyltransferase family 92 protein F13G3.3-like [Haliotis rubra]|uniref:glycosyltransferase family 92 protein F13G3.3-like n=1 Tax=Haliotis rubra TaxID=36100 RepID=UPI001EE597D3|nr:glycosyltransferase family 92 protein F13G3.3-like [Haliotis rubra]